MADGTSGGRENWGRWAFAALFLVGGVGHFAATDFYLKIMPPYLLHPRALVLLSGAAEIGLGALLLVPRTTRPAAWGLIALLIAVFPANLYMYQNSGRFSVPPLALLIRLPLQGLLIWWAYRYTRARPAASVRGESVREADAG